MKTSRRNMLSRVMIEAWHLARQGAQKFGGSAKLYFGIALHLIWQDRQRHNATVWHRGLGNLFLLPGLAVPTNTNGKRQILLPGMGK